MTPKWPWPLKGQRCTCYNCPQLPVHQMTPKMTLNTKRSKLPHTHVYNYPNRVANFTLFHSTARSFRVTGHFEISALNDPKMTLNTKRSEVPHIHVTTTWSQKFHSILLYGQPFPSYRPFWDKCIEWPEMTFTTTCTSKVPYIQVLQVMSRIMRFLFGKPWWMARHSRKYSPHASSADTHPYLSTQSTSDLISLRKCSLFAVSMAILTETR